MSSAALTFVSYVWHYLVARLLYDQLARPLIHDGASRLLLIAALIVAAFVAGWWSGTRRARRRDRLAVRRRA